MFPAVKRNNDITLENIYKFLALSLKYPDSSWFNEGYISNCLAIMREAGLQKDAKAVEECFQKDAFLEELQLEYTRLFINAVPHTIAPPFGSVYLEKDRSLYGNTTERVRNYYRSHNFDLINPGAIPDDIVIELEFLSVLASLNNEKAEQEFLEKYFRPWFVTFRDIVLIEARHPFYKGMVRLIDFFTSQEED